MLANFYKWVESNRIVMLGNYLEDNALSWYIENYENYSFNEIECKLIARFGIEILKPIVEFVNLKYD